LELFVYFLPSPPYFLLVAGLLAGLASGAAFSATLTLLVQDLAKTTQSTFSTPQQNQLFFPFAGILAGACVFLASGIEAFGFPRSFAYLVALVLIAGTGRLVWTQLVGNVKLLLQGGSRALDLDIPE
jgi:hypothetical protein